MPPVKSKLKLHYHFVKKYEQRRCSSCHHHKQVTMPWNHHKELRCEPIGLDDSRKYRIHENGCCDAHVQGKRA